MGIKDKLTIVIPSYNEWKYIDATITSIASQNGIWGTKVIVFYPKDFTFVCPTEIVAYDKLNKDFADREIAP